MRSLAPAIGLLVFGSIVSAHADPYRWCAVYGGYRGGGSQSCYFMTLAQCRAQIAGLGGTCRPNPFFDGRPVRTPEERGRNQRSR
jgi:hypothetical protein